LYIYVFYVATGMLSHAPTSGLESGMASMRDFYKEDELKYHGKVNRGVRQLNLLQVPTEHVLNK
jgi:hypothetical protein